MVKIVIFFNPTPGMAVDEFRRYWRTRHAEIIVRLPGLRRYVQSHVLAAAEGTGAPAFAAVAESSFDDTQAMKLLAGSAEYAAVLADEPNFIDRSSMGSIITDEDGIKAGPVGPNAVKCIEFVNRSTGVPIDAFRTFWRETHAPRYAALPGVRRYVQNPTRPSIYASGKTPAFDGVAMSWFESMAAFRSAASTPEFARLRDELDSLVARGSSPSVVAEEHVILG